jgi:hypothetical protein
MTSYRAWLGPGHTIPCDADPDRFAAVLLDDSARLTPGLELPPVRGARVALLWMIPINAGERDQAMRHGSTSLLESLRLTLPRDS